MLLKKSSKKQIKINKALKKSLDDEKQAFEYKNTENMGNSQHKQYQYFGDFSDNQKKDQGDEDSQAGIQYNYMLSNNSEKNKKEQQQELEAYYLMMKDQKVSKKRKSQKCIICGKGFTLYSRNYHKCYKCQLYCHRRCYEIMNDPVICCKIVRQKKQQKQKAEKMALLKKQQEKIQKQKRLEIKKIQKIQEVNQILIKDKQNYLLIDTMKSENPNSEQEIQNFVCQYPYYIATVGGKKYLKFPLPAGMFMKYNFLSELISAKEAPEIKILPSFFGEILELWNLYSSFPYLFNRQIDETIKIQKFVSLNDFQKLMMGEKFYEFTIPILQIYILMFDQQKIKSINNDDAQENNKSKKDKANLYYRKLLKSISRLQISRRLLKIPQLFIMVLLQVLKSNELFDSFGEEERIQGIDRQFEDIQDIIKQEKSERRQTVRQLQKNMQQILKDETNFQPLKSLKTRAKIIKLLLFHLYGKQSFHSLFYKIRVQKQKAEPEKTKPSKPPKKNKGKKKNLMKDIEETRKIIQVQNLRLVYYQKYSSEQKTLQINKQKQLIDSLNSKLVALNKQKNLVQNNKSPQPQYQEIQMAENNQEGPLSLNDTDSKIQFLGFLDKKYLWFTQQIPDKIFVNESDSWGFYSLQEINKILSLLNLKICQDRSLHDNLKKLISANKLIAKIENDQQSSYNALQQKQYQDLEQKDLSEFISNLKTINPRGMQIILATLQEQLDIYLIRKRMKWIFDNDSNAFKPMLEHNISSIEQALSVFSSFYQIINSSLKVDPTKTFWESITMRRAWKGCFYNTEDFYQKILLFFVLSFELTKFLEEKKRKFDTTRHYRKRGRKKAQQAQLDFLMKNGNFQQEKPKRKVQLCYKDISSDSQISSFQPQKKVPGITPFKYYFD